ncbi:MULTISPECIES: hypothetical protein [Nguyenibacter]|uniref:Uncharacterized protein n=1 Tax=Nguyenibacter vanlangensis TaxID=1216886 RepID=A0A7Y7IX41_9PROT|nr:MULTISPECIES: hypothetical protein [Nguyenibacter]NVN11430.1 hypothetical protein [Nguyenibacter vanlangensis]WRH89403.1 hypothetical protein QN315_07370 [Nguyenibacter sp. L1]
MTWILHNNHDNGHTAETPFATAHERRTALVAAAIVVGFVATIILACAFMPTIPLYHF